MYRNPNSELFEFDFFAKINDVILQFLELGHIFLTGDTNSRVGERPDYVERLDIDRYVDIPDDEPVINIVTERKSKDVIVNTFGNKLLSLCKDNNLCIVNGRLDEGHFTCYSVKRRIVGASVVDYLITDAVNFDMIDKFDVLDYTEYSDHCPLHFTFNYLPNNTDPVDTGISYIDKICWESCKSDHLLEDIQNKRAIFDEI